MSSPFRFELHHTDGRSSARRSTFHTPHGPVEFPAFMPVGTQAAVKALTIDQVRSTGAQMILANTYHLALRPGEDVIRALGGLHPFTGWDGPILTDSGGFQLFSLAQNTKVTEQAAVFRSHIDGKLLELSPERAIAIQEALGSDVAMVLDHVIALPAADEAIRDACDRTVRWAQRCRAAATRSDQAQFAIIQGGLNPELRAWCVRQLADLDFPGYAVGGLSVGESPDEMYKILDVVCPAMPADKPRYLMGVGTPQDLLHAIRRGIDLFDCVMPTRNGRNALAFTDAGPLRLRNEIHKRDDRPLEEACPCLACRHSRAYLRHLFLADEMLGPILLTHHNLTYYQRLLGNARRAIETDRFTAFFEERISGWQVATETHPLP
ncbi:MAG TPA: tRNA guanosine(34) transglycosylase Tgt [Pirellulaceae bacterium]|nr:tRNA guanosine(34) transglycosylase Tgt [Pirellulaceae bacterium]